MRYYKMLRLTEAGTHLDIVTEAQVDDYERAHGMCTQIECDQNGKIVPELARLLREELNRTNAGGG